LCRIGHNLKGPVIEHPFYGTDKIIKTLQKHPDWSKGYITLTNHSKIRDENNLVNDIIF
jgi:hypothetical protein